MKLPGRPDREPVAIIGIGCRLPGGADGPDSFWRLLREGVDAIGEVPPERWDLAAFYDEDPAAPGKMNTRWGGFLERIDGFDASFFGISPREAAPMDPQQRLLLEVTWEALEDAGQVRDSLAGTPVGVFIGISTFDYGALQLGDPRRVVDGYLNTGSALSIAANRISYFFDFRGPSMAIDTACSSSLVATHLACQSLWSGESTLAVAGGVNLILSPAVTIGFSKLKAMAPDGRCKAFDARSDGFVRSEGAGVVVLKPLASALRDGDPIYALIRGAAINQDGRTNGLIAPNGLSQEALLRRTLAEAGVAPADVSYVEAHGTGTALGDPIEMMALGKVLAAERALGRKCAVGSVKTNLGHLEAAAGVAGLIKLALSLKHGEIPPSLHFHEPNPYIPFDELPLYVQTSLTPWPRTGPRLACVSSFGFGGTNACAVLEGPIEVGVREADEAVVDRAHLFPLSASSREALDAVVSSHLGFLRNRAADETSLTGGFRDLCYTAGARRTHHDHRLALTARGREELIERLEAFQRGETRPGSSSGRRIGGRRRKLAFVFSGHGAQWLGMGRGLLLSEPVFRDALEACDLEIGTELGWSLLERLRSDEQESDLDRVGIVQPAVFAIQVALAALWRHLGIEPDAVVGHSMGEAAAAYVAGCLTLEEATRVICRRSRLLTRIGGKGAMASVELSPDEARHALRGYENRIAIAVVNSRRSTVLSGDPEALAEITRKLSSQGVYCRAVKTDVAFHGPQVDPLTASLRGELEGLTPRRGSIPMISTVTGSVVDGLDLDASYWARNLREPVLFATAVRLLRDQGHDVFLELGPHPILLPAIQQELDEPEVVVLPSMRRGKEERSMMLGSLGALYTLGRKVDWEKLHPGRRRCLPLPSYPWQRERFWIEGPRSAPSSPEGGVSAPSGGVVSKFYDSLSRTRSMHGGAAAEGGEAYLTFAPFRRPLPGFSWLNAFFHPEDKESAKRVVNAQRELRAALFGRVDFSGVTKVLDFGCGYASDVIALSEKFEHLRIDGFTISAEQAAIGNEKVRARRLDERVRVFNRDSSNDEFPDQYDLVFGLEVAGHIENKGGLFSNVSRHLAKSGLLLMADFVANTAVAIDHDDLGTYACRALEWADVLARNGLRVVEGIDVSEEIANSLEDPDFDKNLERLAREQTIEPIVQKNLRSFNNYGKALRRRLLSYVLFIVQRDSYLLKNELRRGNEEKLKALIPYDEGLRRSAWFQEDVPGGADSAASLPQDCFYRVEWEAKELGTSAGSDPRGRFVLFADGGGFGRELEASLAERGESSVLVLPGDRYERMHGNSFRIRPDSREDADRLLSEVLELSPEKLLGAVHLWSLDAPEAKATTLDSLEKAQSLGCGSVVHWIQSLVRRDGGVSPRLWVVTRVVHPLAGRTTSAPAVSDAPLWGLARAIAQEHPSLWGGLVALDDLSPREGALRLSSEIRAADGDDQVLLRSDGRYVARLAPSRDGVRSPSPPRIRADASYLITGGLGDLGLLVARFLVQGGARSLILLGRSRLLPRSEWGRIDEASRMRQQVAAIQALESLGARVHLASVDVSNEEKTRGFLDRWNEKDDGPIRGVVHAAGWVGVRPVQELDLDLLRATMRPKVAGAWILHRYFEERPLDFFVLFSSAASVLGFMGQGLGHYAAANAFLDGLAHYRYSRHLPAISINWGPWSEVGMAARIDQANRLSPYGIRSIPPERGLDLLRQVLALDSAQVVALDADWPLLSRSFPTAARSPFLSRVVSRRESREGPAPASVERRLSPARVLDADPVARRRILETEIRDRVSGVLGLSPSKLDVHEPLVNLGLDSLMGVELKNQIESELRVTLSLSELMQGASVARLALLLADKLEGTVSDLAGQAVRE